MKFIKNNLKTIMAIVITMVLTGGIVGATVYQYQASDVKYGGTTVGAAINDLYGSVNAQGTAGGISIKNYVDSVKNSSTTLTCPSGKICIAYTYCTTTTSNAGSCALKIDGVRVGWHFLDYTNETSSRSNSYILAGGQTIQYWSSDNNYSYSYLSLFSN